ncbi:hypothetical protein CY34DRAFT_211643 [Suillus luteus UH-Slu-Lm8-n1]|uniref:Uncharacterized protein n=1 Tax=Suillus luteus UH-Slu-Lm8-n1 TaxID=930992 RepID=A0A0D0B104_9AGAM|nr:hypothetical protein CY34DRAFT_211643 [Suillus luteus UH-Slu-Lm8-n1]
MDWLSTNHSMHGIKLLLDLCNQSYTFATSLEAPSLFKSTWTTSLPLGRYWSTRLIDSCVMRAACAQCVYSPTNIFTCLRATYGYFP